MKTASRLPQSSASVRSNVLQRKCTCNQNTVAGGECVECHKKHLPLQQYSPIQLDSEVPGEGEVPPSVYEVLRSPGQPLDSVTRTLMESRFGHDFSQVRVHTDAKAAKSAQAVNALAYTVGRDIVFGPGQYRLQAQESKRLLVHELVHVIQQHNRAAESISPLTMGDSRCPLEREANSLELGLAHQLGYTENLEEGNVPSLTLRFPISPARPESVQRKESEKGTGKGKNKEKKTKIEFKFGELRFVDETRKDLLKGGMLLPGADNAHISLSDDGRLGYDTSYTEPTDPFRWEKIKFLIDSKEKILVNKVGLGDKVKIRKIHEGKAIAYEVYMLRQLGLTFPTEAVERRVYPTKTSFNASPSSDTHYIYYTTDLSDPDRSSLPHELLGHLWLALKGVPFIHPKEPTEIAAFGTLKIEHGITDPFGGIYTGPVKEFIDRYIGSEQFSRLKSPTHFVGKHLLDVAFTSLKKDFPAKAAGKLNGPWNVPDNIALMWETISTNYELATVAAPDLSRSIKEDVKNWYSGLSIDQQYVFIMYLKQVQQDFLRKTKLATELLNMLKGPAGMTRSEK